jgi:hypothetical protein
MGLFVRMIWHIGIHYRKGWLKSHDIYLTNNTNDKRKLHIYIIM